MSNIMTRDDHGINIIDLIGDGGNRTCAWNEYHCAETPTHLIRDAHTATEERPVSFYCKRHYILTLAHLLEVHVPYCAPLDAHLDAYGTIEEVMDSDDGNSDSPAS